MNFILEKREESFLEIEILCWTRVCVKKWEKFWIFKNWEKKSLMPKSLVESKENVVNKEKAASLKTTCDSLKFPLKFSPTHARISLSKFSFSHEKENVMMKKESSAFSHFSDFTFPEENCHKLATFRLVIFFSYNFCFIQSPSNRSIAFHVFSCSDDWVKVEWKVYFSI